MNTPVSFPIAKLLKEKGYNENGCLQEVWLGNKYEWRGKGKNKKSVGIPVFGLGSSSVLPTISEVVMWLYEKHGIWVSVTFKRHSQNKHFSYNIRQANGIETYLWEHNSPTEAYEAAIEYTLNNLI